jgi:hypothetical protein
MMVSEDIEADIIMAGVMDVAGLPRHLLAE